METQGGNLWRRAGRWARESPTAHAPILRRRPLLPTSVIRVRVKPNARASLLTQSADGGWVAHIKAPPIEGKANQELIALVAQQFHCVKAAVAIKSGASGRIKVVRIKVG